MTFQDKLEKILLNFVYGDDLSTKGTVSAIVSATLELVGEDDIIEDGPLGGTTREGEIMVSRNRLRDELRTKIKDKSDFIEAIRMEEFDTALPSEPSDSPDELSDFLFSTTNVGDDLIGEAVFDQAKLERLADLIAERERLAKIEVLKKMAYYDDGSEVSHFAIGTHTKEELANLQKGTKDE